MSVLTKPFQKLQAADLMSQDLLLIPDDTPLREAARRLIANHVSGAPVIDCRGILVGVLSATDFVRHATGAPSDHHGVASSDICSEWQMVDVEALPDELVRGCMTADPVTARKSTPIAELARMMIDAHIHRVIIVDEAGAPTGIVTSTDILAAVARC